MSLQLFNIPDWDGNAESALSCGRPMPKRTACQLVKKARQVFLTALLPPSILPGAKCCYARKALKNQGFSVAGYCITRRALLPRAPPLLYYFEQ